MGMNAFSRRLLALLCSVALIVGGVSPALSGMVGTDQLIAAEQAGIDRDHLLDTLARDEVREQLSALGVDPAQATARVERMTDAEVAALNQRLDELPVGASGTLLGVVVVLFILFLVLDAVGATDFFPFIKAEQ